MGKNPVHREERRLDNLRNYFELNYRITAGLFWALFCGLTFFALSQICCILTQAISRVFMRKRLVAVLRNRGPP